MSDTLGNPLEDLLREALAAAPAKRNRARNSFDPAEKPKLSGLGHHSSSYTDGEANWTRTRGVALIHRDSNTLLGNFSEFAHRHSSARKLVRTEEPLLVEGTEWVSGPQWIEWSREPEAAVAQVVVLEIVADLHLHELGVRAMAATVEVTISYGGVSKVELFDLTHFHSDDHRVAFFLPKHLNVLDGLSLDTKLAIRAECGL